MICRNKIICLATSVFMCNDDLMFHFNVKQTRIARWNFFASSRLNHYLDIDSTGCCKLKWMFINSSNRITKFTDNAIDLC